MQKIQLSINLIFTQFKISNLLLFLLKVIWAKSVEYFRKACKVGSIFFETHWNLWKNLCCPLIFKLWYETYANESNHVKHCCNWNTSN